MYRLFFSISVILFSARLAAETAVSTAQPALRTAYNEPFSSEALVQLVVGLLVVVAIIFILSWAFKRFSGISPISKNMRVLGVLPLSTREKAVLVKVGDQQILLGVAPGRVSHLHSFDEAVVDVDAKPNAFSARLGEALKQRQADQDEKKTDE